MFSIVTFPAPIGGPAGGPALSALPEGGAGRAELSCAPGGDCAAELDATKVTTTIAIKHRYVLFMAYSRLQDFEFLIL
jgi:hypothetical protein